MRNKIKETIYTKRFDGDQREIYFSDLPKDIQDNDIIDIIRDEGYYSENNSYNAYTELIISRVREETDEEYQNRISENKRIQEVLKKNRYKNYLKLKSEFEPEKDKQQ